MKRSYLVFISLFILTIFGIGLYSIFSKDVVFKYSAQDNLNYLMLAAQSQGDIKEKNIQQINIPDNIENNLDVDEKSEKLLKWIISEKIDLVGLSTDDFLELEKANPGAYKAILFLADDQTNFMTSVIVGKDSEITNTSGLKGKKVATDSGINQALISRYFKGQGIEVTPIYSTRDKWGELLGNKSADAVWAEEPELTQLIITGKAKKLIENPSSGGAITHVFAVRNELIEKNSREVRNLSAALLKTGNLDKSKIKNILAEKFDKSKKAVVESRNYPSVKKASENQALFQEMADLLYDQKAIKQKTDISKLVY